MSRNSLNKQHSEIDNIVTRLSSSSPQSYRALSSLVRKYKRKQMSQLEIYEEMVNIFQNNTAYLDKLNNLLHSSLKITSETGESGKEPLSSQTIFEEMFIKLKETYPDRYAPCSNRIRYISEVVIEAARKQTNPRSDPQPRKIQIQGYIENIKETNLPSEIIQYIVNFLEARLDTRGTIQQAYKKILSPDFTSTQEDGYEDYQDPEDRTAHTIDSSNRLNNNRNKMKNYIPQESHSQMTYQETTRNPVMNVAKSENYFFEMIKEHLSPKNHQMMMKLIQIYMNCILSYQELLSMAKPILLTLDKKMWALFKEIFESREGTRKRTSVFFLGIKEKSDNSMFHPRVNESYHKLNDNVPIIKNTTDDQIAIDNINVCYFSTQPMMDKTVKESNSRYYEAGVSKKNVIKNLFEEALFKIEDERFEIDVNIERFKAVIGWLEIVNNPKTSETTVNHYIDKIKKFQVIELIYGSKLDEIIKGIELHRATVVPLVIRRIQEKLEVIQESKQKYENDSWNQISETNFHRSLDCKSCFIKQADKKVLLNKNFVAELEFRDKALHSGTSILKNRAIDSLYNEPKLVSLPSENADPDDEVDFPYSLQLIDKVKDLIEPYNSFYGVSTEMRCHTNKSPAIHLESILTELNEHACSLPVFSFNMSNPTICEDVLEAMEVFLTYNSANKNNDKTKIRQNLAQIFSCFLEMKMPSSSSVQVKYNLDGNLIEKMESLERRLYKLNFSFGNCVREKVESKMADREPKTQIKSELDCEEEAEAPTDAKQKEKDVSASDRKEEKEEDDDENPEPPEYLKKLEPKSSKKEPAAPVEDKPKEVDEDDIAEEGDEKSDDGKSGDKSDKDRDSFDRIINGSNSYDSSKDMHTKPMTYKPQTELSKESLNANDFLRFLPRPNEKGKVFFAGQHFYICLRFFYTLFERFLMAYELSYNIPDNAETRNYSAEEKQQLGAERYEAFKETLKLFLKECFDSTIYEDCLRCIFGIHAGFLFFIDKIFGSIIKNLPSDELSTFVLETRKEIFKEGNSNSSPEEEPTSESIKYTSISQKMREIFEQKGVKNTQASSSLNQQFSNLLRYYYDCDTNTLHINMVPSLYNKWNQKSLKHAKKYFDSFVNEERSTSVVPRIPFESPIFLTRNRKLSSLQNLNPQKVKISNKISYKTQTNHLKLIPSVVHREDILVRLDTPKDQLKTFKTGLNRVLKFREWLKTKTEKLS